MAWSYFCGEGVSWVRAYEEVKNGRLSLYLEWFEDKADENGVVLINPKTLKPLRRRARQKLPHKDYRRAEDECRAASDAFLANVKDGPMTVHRLIDEYILEVTPTKGESKQDHDNRAARLFKLSVSAERLAQDMDRSDWDKYCNDRKNGLLAKLGPVGNRQLQYDLKFMISVLGWGVGTTRLTAHPWGPEIRKVQGWKMPRNPTPLRPQMTDEIRALLSANTKSWELPLALELARETISRNASVSKLRWVDIDFTRSEVVWAYEKNGGTYRTPLSRRAVELLRAAPSRGIGQAWVFPAPKNPSRPRNRHSFQILLRRAKAKLLRSIPDPVEREQMKARLKGLGFHGEKRAAVRDPEFRKLPGTVREALSRTSQEVLDDVYDEVPMDVLHQAVGNR